VTVFPKIICERKKGGGERGTKEKCSQRGSKIQGHESLFLKNWSGPQTKRKEEKKKEKKKKVEVRGGGERDGPCGWLVILTFQQGRGYLKGGVKSGKKRQASKDPI